MNTPAFPARLLCDLVAFTEDLPDDEFRPAFEDGQWRIRLAGRCFRFDAENLRSPEFRRPAVWMGWQEESDGRVLRAVEFYCTAAA